MSATDRRYGIDSNVAVKAPVRAATTAPIVLSGTQTIDAVVLAAGDRCLVKDQVDQTTNGIYQVDTGTWTRTGDCDGPYDIVQGSLVYVVNGTANGNKFFQETTADPITIGSSNLVFSANTIAFSGLSANSVATANIQNNAVTYAKVQQASANTVLGNPTAGAANISEIALAVSQLLGRGATGNVAAITLGSGLSMSGATLSAPSASTALPALFRLSLTTGDPTPSADVTGAATIYAVPYLGNGVQLYSGTGFVAYTSAQLSLALDATAAHTGYHQNGKKFDCFLFMNGGAVTLGTGPAWSTDASRGVGAGTTELQYQSGIYTNKNQITLRIGSNAGDTVAVAANQATYIGTFRASADGQATDSKLNRGVYNYHGPRVADELERVVTPLTNVGGTANAITANSNMTVPALRATKLFSLMPTAANTAATTINIDALGAVNIFANGAACKGGEIANGVPLLLYYDGTQCNIVGPAAQSHASAAKAWIEAAGDGSSITVSFNVSGITDVGAGVLGVTIDIDFASANYVAVPGGASSTSSTATARWYSIDSQLAGSFRIFANRGSDGASVDPNVYYAACFGAQ